MRICIVLLAVISSLLLAEAVLADRGVVPFGHFDVYEPGQKAIIAWNGEVEVLVLSADLALPPIGGGERVVALELIPLPSEPSVELGSAEVFREISEYLAREYRGKLGAPGGYRAAAGVELVFHERLGPHEISVLKVEDVDELVAWIEKFSTERGLPLPGKLGELRELVADYVERGYDYLVLDVVVLEGGGLYSVDPIVYEFETRTLYYPVKISSIAGEPTVIQLVLLTEEPLALEDLERAGFNVLLEGRIPREIVEDAGEYLAILEGDEYWLTLAVFSGRVEPHSPDLEARTGLSLKRYLPQIAFLASLVPAVLICTLVLIRERDRKEGRGLLAPAMLLSLAGLAVVVPPASLVPVLLETPPGLRVELALASGAYVASSALALTAAYLLFRGKKSGGILGWLSAILMVLVPLCCLASMVAERWEPSPLAVLHLAAGAAAFLPCIASLILLGLNWDSLA